MLADPVCARMDDSEMEPAPSGSSSIGEAASGRGRARSNEEEEGEGGDYDIDDDLYYIPERRPSLDLGPSPMDTSHWYREIFLLSK